ncbi:MAG: 4Fe-4S dicluster domain-containing protein [Ignavibacteriales bacterium]|nr:MAG: 4Fe-4S dicluster domain-containing protein [Ignavibacteriales bacterium]
MGLKKLFIDIPAVINSGVPADEIKCEYLFHNENHGAFSLLEVAQFAVYCRQCKDAFCVSACPREAIEHQENGTIKRYNMRCVGCKSCVLACPFGTIFPEVINYITSKCDFCLNQLNEYKEYSPACVQSSPPGGFTIREFEKEEPDKNIFFAGEHLAIKSHSWRMKEGKL